MKGLAGATWLAAAASVLLAFACYLPALDGAFISDDKVLVAGNPATRSPGAALAAFVRPYWQGLKPVNPYYRPLPLLSYAADRALGGGGTLPFHLSNVALHALNGILAAWLVAGLLAIAGPGTPRAPAAGMLLAAALAAAHPIHSEPVAAIYGRPDLMACAGVLLFLNLAVRGRPVPAVPALLAGLLSKESSLLVPLLAPAAFALGARRLAVPGSARGREAVRVAIRARRLVPAGTALAALAAGIYLWLRHAALGSLLAQGPVSRLDNPLASAGALERWLTPFAVLGRGVALWLWPSALCADRGFGATPVASSPGPYLVAGMLLLGGALALIALLAARRSAWALVPAAAILAWLPASGLLVLSPAIMAERFLYTPSILACVLAGGLLARLAGPREPAEGESSSRPAGRRVSRGPAALRPALLLLAAAAVALLAARTFVRAGDFASDLTLHASDAAACPGSAKARYNLGNALSRAGRHREAADSFRRAGAIAPWLAVAHANRGAEFLRLGRPEEAAAAYRAALQADPSLVTARASLAGALYLTGRLGEALVQAEAALEMGPSREDAAQIRELISRIRRSLAGESPDPGAGSSG